MGVELDRRWRLASALYVVVEATLMAVATVDPNHPRIGVFVTAVVLCLPTLIVAGPVVYLLVAAVWSVTDADVGGSTWPVTIAYTAAIGIAAAANVVMLDRISRRRTLAM